MRRARALAATTLCAGVLAGGCIIPDYDIETETVQGNPGPVRMVEATNLPLEFADDCAPLEEPGTCSQVPSGRRSGLVVHIDETTGERVPYCVCLEGSADLRTVPEFFIYAEDPDADELYAVALLDLDPQTREPQRFVAYNQHFAPGNTGEVFRVDEADVENLADADKDPDTNLSLLAASIERDDRLVRFRFGKNNGAGADLCNDNNGEKLDAGMHTLQILVTDRPFFRPIRVDAEGEPVIGSDGEPQFDAIQFGMPDLAAGATWSIANYVFECVAGDTEAAIADEDSVCACAPEDN